MGSEYASPIGTRAGRVKRYITDHYSTATIERYIRLPIYGLFSTKISTSHLIFRSLAVRGFGCRDCCEGVCWFWNRYCTGVTAGTQADLCRAGKATPTNPYDSPAAKYGVTKEVPGGCKKRWYRKRGVVGLWLIRTNQNTCQWSGHLGLTLCMELRVPRLQFHGN